jgi:uncharacterized membrane protein
MKLATRIATVLALAAFAVPALACEGMKTHQASNEKKPAVAKAEKN